MILHSTKNTPKPLDPPKRTKKVPNTLHNYTLTTPLIYQLFWCISNRCNLKQLFSIIRPNRPCCRMWTCEPRWSIRAWHLCYSLDFWSNNWRRLHQTFLWPRQTICTIQTWLWWESSFKNLLLQYNLLQWRVGIKGMQWIWWPYENFDVCNAVGFGN